MSSLIILMVIVVLIGAWFLWKTSPKQQERSRDRLIKSLNEYIEEDGIKKYGKEEWEKKKKKLEEESKDIFKDTDFSKICPDLEIENRNRHKLIIVSTVVVIFVVFYLAVAMKYHEHERKYAEKIKAENFSKEFAEAEIKEMEAGLEKWRDYKLVEELLGVTLTDEYIKNLYEDLKNTLVSPPKPGTYAEYEIQNAEQSLADVEQLGRKVYNLTAVMIGNDRKRYWNLIATMVDLLYSDYREMKYAIRHDPTRYFYWYGLHYSQLKDVKKQYLKLFKI